MNNPNSTARSALKERSRFDDEPATPTAWGDLSGESAGASQVAPSAPETFFSALVGLEPLEQVEACREEGDRLIAHVAFLEDERRNTARGHKARAHELLVEITQTQARIKRIVAVRKVYQGQLERQQEQYLWAAAVREIAGQETLTACYAWMKAERRRRLACPDCGSPARDFGAAKEAA